MQKTKKPKNYYFSNRDLLVIAVLSGIGGVMSTYVGYIGNLINRVMGVPFGAGQFASGLHVFWFIIAAGLVRKPGATAATGLLKGLIELFTGSSHGLVIVLVSLIQGGVVDLVLLLTRHYNLYSYMVAGGIAAASNVFVFQALYFSGVRITYLLFISLLAFISGVLLAGGFGHSVLEVVLMARPIRIGADQGPATAASVTRPGRIPIAVRFIATALLILLFSGGAIYYFAAIFEPPGAGPRCQVEGAVGKPIAFTLAQFGSHETSITAELRGQFKYEPPQQYTGVPLSAIVNAALPLETATTVTVAASDGYTVKFDLGDVLADDQMLLIQEQDQLRLIAGSYDGGYWVRMVNKIMLE
jgi:ABC-type thiamin/hydroxymethylpyrimidine transport system permease subunit